MTKLAITITNYNLAMYLGGPLEIMTHIIEIENEELENLLRPVDGEAKTISIVKEDAHVVQPKP